MEVPEFDESASTRELKDEARREKNEESNSHKNRSPIRHCNTTATYNSLKEVEEEELEEERYMMMWVDGRREVLKGILEGGKGSRWERMCSKVEQV